MLSWIFFYRNNLLYWLMHALCKGNNCNATYNGNTNCNLTCFLYIKMNKLIKVVGTNTEIHIYLIC